MKKKSITKEKVHWMNKVRLWFSDKTVRLTYNENSYNLFNYKEMQFDTVVLFINNSRSANSLQLRNTGNSKNAFSCCLFINILFIISKK